MNKTVNIVNPKSLRIVIADDEEAMVKILCLMLEEMGHQIVGVASDGRQAVAMVKAHRPDIIIMDIRMPNMDGIEASRVISEEIPTPIVVLSGFGEKELVEQASHAGAAAYLVKDTIGSEEGNIDRAMTIAIARFKEWVSELRYRRLFESTQDGIFLLDAETGVIIEANPYSTKLLGYSIDELKGKRFWEIPEFMNVPEIQETFNELQKKEYVRYDDLSLETPNGQIIVTFVSNVYSVGDKKIIQCNIRDITQEKHLEQQLHQAQRLESLGILAGGIAHDFNNILSGIGGYSELARTELSQDELSKQSEIYYYLTQISTQVDRAALLIRQLMTFSRDSSMVRRPLNLNDFIDEMSKMLKRILPETITIHTSVADAPAMVLANTAEMQQVVLNLATNARDAMPDGGYLFFRIRHVTLREADCRNNPEVKPGQYVCLSVRDSGMGIAPEIRERIFDPLATTKENGFGTGLGLFMVYGIVVKQHEGHINVYSEVGRGTEFKLYFPAIQLEQPQEVDSDVEIKHGNETLLFVEDELFLRDLGRQMLEYLGYTVLTAENGAEALNMYQQHKGKIDLVLTDMLMPQMGGRELYHALMKINPAVKVLLMSGYSLDEEVARLRREGAAGFIQKPFGLFNLAQQVRMVLDSDKQGAGIRNAEFGMRN